MKTAAVQALPGGTGVSVIVSIDECLGPFRHVGRCSGKRASKWHFSRAGLPGGLLYSPSFHFQFRAQNKSDTSMRLLGKGGCSNPPLG